MAKTSGTYEVPGDDELFIEVWWDRYTRMYVVQLKELPDGTQIGDSHFGQTGPDALGFVEDFRADAAALKAAHHAWDEYAANVQAQGFISITTRTRRG